MDNEVEEVSFLPGADSSLSRRCVYEPSKSQRCRQVACTRTAALTILAAMALLTLAIAIIAAFARPATPTCETTPSVHEEPPPVPEKTYMTDDGRAFPWRELRLPRDVIPVSYDLFLHPNISRSEYSGQVVMTLEINKATDFIVFHSSKLEISAVSLVEILPEPEDLQTRAIRHLQALLTSDLKSREWYSRYSTLLSRDKRSRSIRHKRSGRDDIVGRFPRDLVDEVEVVDFLEYVENQQVYVQLGKVVTPGSRLQLTVTFNGQFADDSEMTGFYKSTYEVQGQTRTMVSSHFEPTFARSAFPCLDEPDMKATFSLSIVREARHISLFNSRLVKTEVYRQDLLLDKYEQTAIMSSYLVAFVVCDFKNISAHTADVVQVRMFAPEDKISMGQFALNSAVTVLDNYNLFFGLKYPLAKLDLIAIPNFAAGAMENWGLVTFRDTSVLFDLETGSGSNKRWVATVVAHELAHQWFGNLVTMKWWDDLWLNEGFASFVEYLGTDAVDKEFHMMDKFSQSFSTALYADSFTNSHPIQVAVDDPDNINSVFDTISYDKGASLIRMLESVMGEAKFKEGLKSYLAKNKYKNARTVDLWNALQEYSDLPQDLSVSKFMDTWTKQMNYPVVTVTRRGGTILLSQERFLLTGKDNSNSASPYNYKWNIPFTLSTSEHPSGKTLVWMKEGSASFSLPDPSVLWVKGNADGKGFYRVNYDPQGWRSIIHQLKTNHSVFSVFDRVTLIGDVFSLARAGLVNYTTALDLSQYLVNETDYFVWVEAVSHLGYLAGRMSLDEDYDLLKAYKMALARLQYEKLGWSKEGHLIDREMRSLMISVAVSCEHEPAVSKATDVFKHWIKTQTFNQSNEIRGLVYGSGIANGNKADWNYVYTKYQEENSPSERNKLLGALTQTKDGRLLQMLLEQSMAGTIIKSQDSLDVISSVAGNINGQLPAWRFFRRKWDTIFNLYGRDSFLLPNTLKGITASFNTQFDYDEIKTFFQTKELGTAKLALRQALEMVENHVLWTRSNLDTIKSWLRHNSPPTVL